MGANGKPIHDGPRPADALYQVALACGQIFVVTARLPEGIAQGLKRDFEAALRRPWPSPDNPPPVTAAAVEPIGLPLPPTQFLQAAAEQVIDLSADDPAEHQLRRSFFRHQDEALQLERQAAEIPATDHVVLELRFVRDFGGAPHDRVVFQRVGVNPNDRANARRWVAKVKNALDKASAGFRFEIVECPTPGPVHERVQDALNDLSSQLRAARSGSVQSPSPSAPSGRRPVARPHPWVPWLREGVEVAIAQNREGAAQAQKPSMRRARPRS